MITKAVFFRYIFFLISAVVLIAISLTDPSIRPWVFAPKDLADFTFTDLTIQQLDNGEMTWEVYADSAEIFNAKKRVDMTTVKALLFDKGHTTTTIHSPTATMSLDMSDIVLSDSPVATFNMNNIDYRVDSNRLRYVPAKQQFFGAGDIALTSPSLKMTGERFELDLTKQTFDIYEDSHATLTID